MSTQTLKISNADMIKEILMAVKAGGGYVGGDLFLALAFRSRNELIQICRELCIKLN